MTYYFPADFEKKLGYFSKTVITETLKNEVKSKVDAKLKELSYDVKLYDYAVKSTIDKINVNFKYGQFYYIWLNAFLRDVDIAVWNGTYDANKKMGLDDKKSSKAADITRSELTKWFKEEFK